MSVTMTGAPVAAHLETLRMPPSLAKVAVDSPKKLRKVEEWRRDSDDCTRAIQLARMSMKEAADALDMLPSQLSEQLAARERPQTERWRSSDRLRGPYLIAQAERQPELFDVVTTIYVRRSER